jgi:AcrR family transcriptional regulator
METATTVDAPVDEQRRRAVLAATVELCRAKGYAGLTVADVADRAGTTADELMRTWPSKAALVISAFRRVIAADLVYADTGDIGTDLRAQLVGMARLLSDPTFGPFLAELVAEAQRDPDTARAFVEYVFRPNRAAARERFATAQEAGQLRGDLDLDVAIDLTFAPIWFRFLLGTGPLSEEYATRVAHQALSGLAPAG